MVSSLLSEKAESFGIFFFWSYSPENPSQPAINFINGHASRVSEVFKYHLHLQFSIK